MVKKYQDRKDSCTCFYKSSKKIITIGKTTAVLQTHKVHSCTQQQKKKRKSANINMRENIDIALEYIDLSIPKYITLKVH